MLSGIRHAFEQLERRVMLAAVPVGPEFQVNTYTTSQQRSPSVATHAEGKFVIAWSSSGQDGSGNGVYAQRYNSAGVPQGSEFRVNTYTADNQGGPVVAMGAEGVFVIAWTSIGQDGSDGVYAQRYDALGLPQGGEFRVNTYTTNWQRFPSVAMDADGDFVIAWESWGQDGSSYGVYAQRYNASGVPQGTEFRVNTYTTNRQGRPTVAMDADGNFAIAWHSVGQDSSDYGVYAQRYNAEGVPRGDEFRVNTYTTTRHRFPSVAMDADGDFVIAWMSSLQHGFNESVYAQRYNAAGVPQGDEFRVNTYTTSHQRFPSAAMDADGDFVIAWQSNGQDGSSEGVYAQRYNAAGVPRGGEFRVNIYTTDKQLSPSVAMDADGDFVIAWTSYGQDGSGYGVYAQRYAVVTAPAVSGSSFFFETAPQRLSFVFDQNVGASLDLSDIIVQALPAGPTVNPSAVSFDSATNTATFSFTGILPDANYRATLVAAGIAGPSGTPMQQDHTFDFFFLSADANRDGVVNLADFNILAANFGQSGSGIDFTKGDFNYDGTVNLQDFNLLASRFGQALPSPTAGASAGAGAGFSNDRGDASRVADDVLT